MKPLLKIIVVLLFLFWGCGPSSYITSSWKAENVHPKKYNKIVVLGLIREADRSIREKMEQHMVADLKELGYNAVCSCDEYNPKAFEGMTEQQAIAKLREAGVDAVLTVSLLDKAREKNYVPGNVYYSPYYVYHHRFYGYYRTIYDRIYMEGYYVINTRYFWESNFYDMETNQLLYSAQSQSFDPSSTEALSHEYGQMIVKNMVKNNILTNQKEASLRPM
jgi:hypothetical protein